MDRSATEQTRARARAIALAAVGAGLCFVIGVAWWLRSGPSPVLAVAPGTRLLAMSHGRLYWLERTCTLWRAEIDDGRVTAEPLEPILRRRECTPDDPRFDSDVIYELSGLGQLVRDSPRQRSTVLERNLLYALALDSRYLYAGNCAQADNCQIERLPAEDNPGDPLLIQAGIHALANIEVDQTEIFWVDRGRHKPICGNETIGDSNVVEYRCHDPVPPRLMAAKKDEPRATERVVLTDFDGRRPLLGARHVYWLGAGGVHRVAKAGGASQLVLPTRALSGFAADGNDVFFAADGGIFRARDGEAVRPLHRTAGPPRGLAVDADFVYWIDTDRNALVRQRR